MSGVDSAAAMKVGWDFLKRQAAILVLRVDGEGTSSAPIAMPGN